MAKFLKIARQNSRTYYNAPRRKSDVSPLAITTAAASRALSPTGENARRRKWPSSAPRQGESPKLAKAFRRGLVEA